MLAAASNLPRHLLSYMADGKVVPIIGQALSIVQTDGRTETVNQLLAERLAQRLAIPAGRLPAGYTLNDVLCAYPEFHSVPSSVYAELREIFEEAALEPPLPLRQLAQIPAFHLFVSTSFDGLMKRALEMERGPIHTLTYFPNSKIDLDDVPPGEAPAILFELFGHISSGLDEYTLSEDDLLEFTRALHSEPLRPARLLEEMGHAHLLFIGNGFPDWLARFFLRTIKNARIHSRRGKQEFIVDASVYGDPRLREFVTYFSRETIVVPTSDPVGFVQELHTSWFQRYPAPTETESAGGAAPPAMADNSDGQQASVFLSYASEDRTAALNIKNSLERIGWSVWFDKAGGLEGGDDYARKIQRQIYHSSIFLPILSLQSTETLPGEGRFFRREWNWAIERLHDFTGSDWEFIIPVPIDRLDFRSAQVPDSFRAKHWIAPAPQGALPTDFLGTMKQKLRQLRKR
jgi:hypothetical protein